ncbi:MAG: rhamnulokinase [Clostridia bacterium]|nr:rhamnulokinase [Clostridia bacterium]
MSKLTTRRVLAIDIGASSGRVILGLYDGTRIVLEEAHRFSNDPVQMGDILYWDVLRLWHEVQQGILRAGAHEKIDAIGIDTWGVDFGLIDARGDLVEHPVHYRDPRTEGIPEEVYRQVSAEELYTRTGLHALRLNTLFQLRALQSRKPECFERASTLLFMPDLLAYFLTGRRACEHTIASTSQLLTASEAKWDHSLIRRVGIPGHIFPELLMPGETYGTVRPQVAKSLGIGEAPVVAVATHDTASAVVAAGAEPGELFLSSGTWSLLGTLQNKPCISTTARNFNLGNEAGVGGTMLLRNIMGLWLVQESRRWWQRGGEQLSYPQLESEALNETEPFAALISPNDPMFEAPGDMPDRIARACAATGQAAPVTRGQVMRSIYESLALQYRLSAAQLQAATNQKFSMLRLVGGGAQSQLLCQMAADALRMPVEAGPVEATALGNTLMQLASLGVLPSAAARSAALKASAGNQRYEPNQSNAFDAVYPRFLQVTGQTDPLR